MLDPDWPRGKTDDDSFNTSIRLILREEKLMFEKSENHNLSLNLNFKEAKVTVEYSRAGMGSGHGRTDVRVNLGMITCPVRFENRLKGRFYPNCNSQSQNQ